MTQQWGSSLLDVFGPERIKFRQKKTKQAIQNLCLLDDWWLLAIESKSLETSEKFTWSIFPPLVKEIPLRLGIKKDPASELLLARRYRLAVYACHVAKPYSPFVAQTSYASILGSLERPVIQYIDEDHLAPVDIASVSGRVDYACLIYQLAHAVYTLQAAGMFIECDIPRAIIELVPIDVPITLGLSLELKTRNGNLASIQIPLRLSPDSGHYLVRLSPGPVSVTDASVAGKEINPRQVDGVSSDKNVPDSITASGDETSEIRPHSGVKDLNYSNLQTLMSRNPSNPKWGPQIRPETFFVAPQSLEEHQTFDLWDISVWMVEQALRKLNLDDINRFYNLKEDKAFKTSLKFTDMLRLYTRLNYSDTEFVDLYAVAMEQWNKSKLPEASAPRAKIKDPTALFGLLIWMLSIGKGLLPDDSVDPLYSSNSLHKFIRNSGLARLLTRLSVKGYYEQAKPRKRKTTPVAESLSPSNLESMAIDSDRISREIAGEPTSGRVELREGNIFEFFTRHFAEEFGPGVWEIVRKGFGWRGLDRVTVACANSQGESPIKHLVTNPYLLKYLNNLPQNSLDRGSEPRQAALRFSSVPSVGPAHLDPDLWGIIHTAIQISYTI